MNNSHRLPAWTVLPFCETLQSCHPCNLLKHVDKCLKSEHSSVLCDLRRSAEPGHCSSSNFVARCGTSLTRHRSSCDGAWVPYTPQPRMLGMRARAVRKQIARACDLARVPGTQALAGDHHEEAAAVPQPPRGGLPALLGPHVQHRPVVLLEPHRAAW